MQGRGGCPIGQAAAPQVPHGGGFPRLVGVVTVAVMIHDVDESLKALVRRDVLNGADVDLSFEAPTKEWAGKRQRPTLSIFLYDVREDLSRRFHGRDEVRNESGIVVDRIMPPRFFKMSYLITAWTERAEDEHRVLSAVLNQFLKSDAIPSDVLVGTLVEYPRHVRATIALPPPQDRSIADIWSALGGELKPSLDLVVTAPFRPDRHFEVGPPVTGGFRATMFDTDRRTEELFKRSKRGEYADDADGDALPDDLTGPRESFAVEFDEDGNITRAPLGARDS